jgi:hypothetical protein
MPDFLVNNKVSRFGPSVVANGDGEFVAVYTAVNEVNIKGQRFSSSGALVGLEFDVNTTTGDNEVLVSVTQTVDFVNPGFVVVWMSERRNVMFQRFNAAGTKLGGEVKVNSGDANGAHRPGVAVLPGRGFVVCWSDADPDGGVRAQRFTNSGLKEGNEIRVDSSPGVHFQPVISRLDPAGFVIAWLRAEQHGFTPFVRAQVFDESGNKEGAEIKGNFSPQDGTMAITFMSNNDTTQLPQFAIAYRTATNIPTGAQVLRIVIVALFKPALSGATPRELETNVTGRSDMAVAEDVAICGLPNRRVAVVWSETAFEVHDHNIKAMILTDDGSILTTPDPRVGVQVNSVATGQQRMPSVALANVTSPNENQERIGIVWHDDSVSGPDQNVRAAKGRIATRSLQLL